MKILGILMIMSILSGCATVLSGPRTEVTINSIPSEQKFVLTDNHNNVVATGVTPKTINLLSGEKGSFNGATYYVALGEDKKHQQGFTMLDSSINNYVFFNIVLGGIPGAGIDILTGSMWELPDTITIQTSK